MEAVKVARREPVRVGSLLRHLATVRALDLLRVRCRGAAAPMPAADPAALGEPRCRSGRRGRSPTSWPSRCGGLGRIAGRHRQPCFCLSCLDKLSYREIGERLRLTTNAVGVLLHRARQRLRELLISVATRIDQRRLRIRHVEDRPAEQSDDLLGPCHGGLVPRPVPQGPPPAELPGCRLQSLSQTLFRLIFMKGL